MCTVCAPCVPLSIPGVHSWVRYSGDIKDAIFMDCCMILKMNKTVYKGRRVNCVVGLFVKVSDFSSTSKYFYSRIWR